MIDWLINTRCHRWSISNGMVEYWQWYHMTRYAVLTCAQKLTLVSFYCTEPETKNWKKKNQKIKTTVLDNSLFDNLPSVLWHCWFGARKSIRPVKIEWWSVGVVTCLEWGADCLHMVQLMPLPSPNPVISYLIWIQTGFTFLLSAYQGCPGKQAVKRV